MLREEPATLALCQQATLGAVVKMKCP